MMNKLLTFGILILLLLPARAQVNPPTVEETKKILLAVIDSCQKAGDKRKEEDTWKELGGKVGFELSVLPFKISCYQKAMVLAGQRGDKQEEMAMLKLIADFHLQLSRFDLAESELFQVLKEEKKLSPVFVMRTYDLLAAVYLAKGDYDKALSYALRTESMMKTTGDSTSAVTFYSRLADIYFFLGRPAEAIAWSKKLLNYSIAENRPSDAFYTMSLIVYFYLTDGKASEALQFLQQEIAKKQPTAIDDQRAIQKSFAKCYQALKQYDLAEKCFLDMIRLGDQLKASDLKFERGYDYEAMGNFYYARGQYDKARSYLEVALKNYEEYGWLQHIQIGHFYLFKVDSAMGNYVAAIKHLEQSNRLRDSIFTIEKNKQIEELQIKYQTAEKDKNLKLLEGKEKLSQAKLQNAESTRNWIIAGASMLLIIAGLLFRQARMRKRNNRTINHKNEQLQHLVKEKEWLLKEVHHRVKNNLHTVIGLLESQAAYLEDDALKANEISKHRIYAMSLIHQQLYKAEDIKTIDMSVYLPELVDYLGESFGTGRQILFQLDIEALKLGVSQAIPVALIVNEAVTNSIKYAFPSGKLGTISIHMHQKGEWIDLVITDDGIGIDPSIIASASTTLGLKLMHGLTDDIEGEIHISNENGTKIAISFLSDPLHEPSMLPQYH